MPVRHHARSSFGKGCKENWRPAARVPLEHPATVLVSWIRSEDRPASHAFCATRDSKTSMPGTRPGRASRARPQHGARESREEFGDREAPAIRQEFPPRDHVAPAAGGDRQARAVPELRKDLRRGKLVFTHHLTVEAGDDAHEAVPSARSAKGENIATPRARRLEGLIISLRIKSRAPRPVAEEGGENMLLDAAVAPISQQPVGRPVSLQASLARRVMDRATIVGVDEGEIPETRLPGRCRGHRGACISASFAKDP